MEEEADGTWRIILPNTAFSWVVYMMLIRANSTARTQIGWQKKGHMQKCGRAGG